MFSLSIDYQVVFSSKNGASTITKMSVLNYVSLMLPTTLKLQKLYVLHTIQIQSHKYLSANPTTTKKVMTNYEMGITDLNRKRDRGSICMQL